MELRPRLIGRLIALRMLVWRELPQCVFRSAREDDVAARIVDLQRVVGLYASQAVELIERERTEAALRASEERFRRYFELGLIGMALTSPAKGIPRGDRRGGSRKRRGMGLAISRSLSAKAVS